MRILLAVMSCHGRPEFSDAIRNTWKSSIPQGEADIKFFLGRGSSLPKEDEIFLNCKDSREGIPEKVRHMVYWAYEQGYDYICKLDDDVIMRPKEFLRSGFHHFDYIGFGTEGSAESLTWTCGGFCYILSRKAMKCLLDSPMPGEGEDSDYKSHAGNDEYWVGRSLYSKGIYLHAELRIHQRTGDHTERQEPPGVFLWCVHMHGLLSKPQEVHEMCRIWRERCSENVNKK